MLAISSIACKFRDLIDDRTLFLLEFSKITIGFRCARDADTLCAGEKAPDSRWSRRCFRRRSHLLFLAPEMWKGSNGIDW